MEKNINKIHTLCKKCKEKCKQFAWVKIIKCEFKNKKENTK